MVSGAAGGRRASRSQRTFCDVLDVSLVTKAPVRQVSAGVSLQRCRRVLVELLVGVDNVPTAARAGWAAAVKHPGTSKIATVEACKVKGRTGDTERLTG